MLANWLRKQKEQLKMNVKVQLLFLFFFPISHMSLLIFSWESCTIYNAVWRLPSISAFKITFSTVYRSQNSLRKRKSYLYIVIFLHCLIKAIVIFTFTSIANNLSFCLQDVKREIFGSVHLTSNVWSTQSSVMGSQTALITWMKKIAVSAYCEFVNVPFYFKH